MHKEWNGIDIALDSANNTITENTAIGNSLAGIHNQFGATGNTYSENTTQGNGANDAEDNEVGSGTAGTANTWKENTCDVSAPAGLCAAPTTGP